LTLRERARNAWNAFRELERGQFQYTGVATDTYNPQRTRVSGRNERSIILAVLTRMAIDVASLSFKHVRVNEDNMYQETVNKSLHQALNISANLDQTGRALIQDIAASMFDEGCVAVVPTLTDDDTNTGSEAWNVIELRTAKVVGWRPEEVDVQLYNPLTGREVVLPFKKSAVAIIQNPWYSW
jgi:hypothetical protein